MKSSPYCIEAKLWVTLIGRHRELCAQSPYFFSLQSYERVVPLQIRRCMPTFLFGMVKIKGSADLDARSQR